jgi:hypothetical protein
MIHTTATYDSIFISEMSNEHLINTVSYLWRALKDKIEEMRWKEVMKWRRSYADALIFQETECIRHQLPFEELSAVSKMTLALPHYITECLIRWIDIKDKVNEIYWRSAWYTEWFIYSIVEPRKRAINKAQEEDDDLPF